LEYGAPGEYLTDRLTDEALKVIDHAGDRPFFLYLAHHSVHTPIEAKQADAEYFQARFAENGTNRNAAYAAMVRNLDESFRRVLDRIAERGLADRTIVIFGSDNGGFLGNDEQSVTDNAPLRSGKGSLYEGGVRVPLLIHWPGVTPAGATCSEPVVSQDLFYTILTMAGLSVAQESPPDGLDLSPLLEDTAAHLDRDALYFHYPHYYSTTSPVSALRARDWKLLHYYEDQHVELYNLRDDLGEQANLAAQRADKARELQQRLHDWLDSVDAQKPLSNPDFSPR
jgi:arylsulfatase A-like enzyme